MNQIRNEKTAYVLKKIVQILFALVLLSVLVFVIARLCPGDPLKAYYGDGLEHMSTAEKEIAREKLGLHDSMAVQYFRWAEGVCRGNLGMSLQYKQPVAEVIGDVWANTLILGGTSYVLTFLFAISLGMFCVLHEESLADRIICRVGTVSANIPSFFLAMVLIMIFGVKLGILPTGGAYSLGNSGSVFDRLLHLILPVSVLVLEHLWYYAYLVRNRLTDETRKEYVLLCRAEGIPRKMILRKHCFRNILPSLSVLMATSLPHILGGTYVVETVFGYPGIGLLSFEAAMYHDYHMLMALTLLTGAVLLIFSMAAEAFSERMDPRIAYEKEFREAVS